MTLYDKIKNFENSGVNALYFENKNITYKTLLSNIRKLMSYFRSKGISKGDVVSVVLPNLPSSIYTFYALNALGVVQNIIGNNLSENAKNGIATALAFTPFSISNAIFFACILIRSARASSTSSWRLMLSQTISKFLGEHTYADWVAEITKSISGAAESIAASEPEIDTSSLEKALGEAKTAVDQAKTALNNLSSTLGNSELGWF